MIDPTARGHRAEDEPDIDGYDDAQRAEIAEVEGTGPTDGVVMTDMLPDFGGDLDDDEVGEDADISDDAVEPDGGFIR
jgi:hypothetical protein